MSEFAALALYPLWAVAAAVCAVALRLGRRTGRGLLSLCFFLAVWVTGLILLETPATSELAERIVPLGTLLAAAFVHAGADVIGAPKKVVALAYAASFAVALIGLVAPGLLYAPGARAPGPLFVPIATVSALGSAALMLWLGRSALRANGSDRLRRGALALACFIGSLGGGGVIGLRVFGLGDVHVAAPLLGVAVGLAAYAVVKGETGRARDVLVQGLAYAVITASFSAIGLPIFFSLLPELAPDRGASLGWLVLVTFFAALPLDPLRMLIVERAGRLFFAKPIGILELTAEVERYEVRADHAERLAEIGRLASAVAHEIRNPLGVIAAQAKLLERQGAKPESVAALREQVERARRFLDDLLRYSRPRPLDYAEVEVLPSLRLVANQIAQQLGESAPAIEVDVAEPGLFVLADRGAFADVATVLVHNGAIAAGPVPGNAVRVVAKRDGGAVWLVVEDDGPGVPREIEASLFEPFVTGRGRDARFPGTGLGLAIASRWMERHGGSIRHERTGTGGARFLVFWPNVAV